MCPRCGERVRPGGKSYCRECYNAYQRERMAEKALRGECRDCSAAATDGVFCDQHIGPHRLRSRAKRWCDQGIGITEDQFEALLGQQAGSCAICFEAASERLNVDHDHSTGKVRGLLCRRCNLLLGKAKDDETILASAINYLRRSRA